jgi:ubiquitin carboxyl-terminal hydrolase 5/13
LTLIVLVDIDVPIVQIAGAGSGNSSSGLEPTPEQINMLADMGFSPQQAKKALRQTVRESDQCLVASLTD